jgi:hypothetical protein
VQFPRVLCCSLLELSSIDLLHLQLWKFESLLTVFYFQIML